MDRGEKFLAVLSSACGDCSILLELAEEVFHSGGAPVHLPVKVRWTFRLLWVGSRVFFRRKQWLDHALVGIEGFIRRRASACILKDRSASAPYQVHGLGQVSVKTR